MVDTFEFYRPGQPNWIFDCGNLAIFQPLCFYVKTILADFTGSKTAILTILEALNFEFWKNFTLENVTNSQKFKIQSCPNGQNGRFWSF